MRSVAYYQLKITIPPGSREPITAHLHEKGCLGLIEDEEKITAYFASTFNIDGLIRELDALKILLEQAGLQDKISFSYTPVPEQDWNASWKKSFVPLDVGGRFTILPPWEKLHPGRINLIIDPGMAFGTGHHETTRSCLVLMEKYEIIVSRDRFLDLGTGTGLLAIAAAKLGCKQVLALDTDPIATEAARTNLGLNGVASVEVREGSISEASGMFDCIAANIISGVLVQLAAEIASRVNPEGIAILSGILAEQADEVITAMQKAGLNLIEKYPDDKWVSVVVRR